MGKKSISRALFIPYIVFMFLLAGGTAVFISLLLSDVHIKNAVASYGAVARLASGSISRAQSESRVPEETRLRETVEAIARETGAGVTLINDRGLLFHSGPDDLSWNESILNRPEVARAFADGVGHTLHPGTGRFHGRLDYAVRAGLADGREAVIRLSFPLQIPAAGFPAAAVGPLLYWLAAAAAGASYLFWLARRLLRPLALMAERLREAGAGFPASLAVATGFEEIHAAAGAASTAVTRLLAIRDTMRTQIALKDSMLESMREGVIAIDTRRQVLFLNSVASVLFHLPPGKAEGRHIEELITNGHVLSLVSRVAEKGGPVETSFTVYEEDERFYQALGTPLANDGGQHLGAIIVLRDVTQLNRLQNMRKEFAMNVSHELKTPLTSIKGFVETLKEEGGREGNGRKRFLEIIAKETDRVINIVEDLLSLARLEKDNEQGSVPVTRGGVCPVVRNAVAECTDLAARKNIRLVLDCDHPLEALLNPRLMEQALVNLIDNAIRYSHENTVVTISARLCGVAIAIAVRDQGPGIAREHLPRLFERFYRVDKARSKELGGTGLGLAIVKHIVATHKGEVSVESEPGKGSCFTVRLPVS